MNGTQRDDLDWLAFRYVAAELSPGESREFERRLEQDQEAREAVGRLVEVTCAVRALDGDAAPRVTPAGHLRPWYRRRGVQVAAGLALGLMLALSFFWPHPSDPTGRQNGSLSSAVPPAELALVWSHARAVLSEQPEDERRTPR
jgi:ferric-dicitrate binding protein FerR (iron transport regulator)